MGFFGLLWKATQFVTKNKWVRWVALALLVVTLVGAGYKQYQHEQQRRIVAEFALGKQKDVVGYLQGRLASSEFVKDSMTGLLGEAEKKLHGKTVAAVVVHVPQRDTTVIHDTLPTRVDTLRGDTEPTRSASFADSAFGVAVSGVVTAPPYPGKLGIVYQFTRKAFNPEVGFVQVGDSVIVVVGWQGERVQIQRAFFKPRRKALPLLGGFGEVNYQWAPERELEWRAGGLVRLGERTRLQVLAENESAFPLKGKDLMKPTLKVGIRREF